MSYNFRKAVLRSFTIVMKITITLKNVLEKHDEKISIDKIAPGLALQRLPLPFLKSMI